MIDVIFSDIHGNLEALDAFSRVLGGIKHDRKICLGDIVGYGADPNACVEWVKAHADIVLAGNHDYAAIGQTDIQYFSPPAAAAALWTRDVLTDANRRYLDSLPLTREIDDVFLAHASPCAPREWRYMTSFYDGVENFKCFAARVCFYGHTHRPLIIEQTAGGAIGGSAGTFCRMLAGHRYIINTGSIGQPRDGDARPAFVVYDSQAATAAYHRFSYDYAPTQRKIRAQGLPAVLAERLAHGL